MSLRCGCKDEGDDIVFGPVHQCSKPRLQDELDRLEREDPEVQAASDRLDAVGEYLKGRLPSSAVAAIYDLTEPRYMETLDEDERRGH